MLCTGLDVGCAVCAYIVPTHASYGVWRQRQKSTPGSHFAQEVHKNFLPRCEFLADQLLRMQEGRLEETKRIMGCDTRQCTTDDFSNVDGRRHVILKIKVA